MEQKIIYIAGFRQHAGKTTNSLGLIHSLLSKYEPSDIGYIKPVGQEMFKLPDGKKIDKDAVLIQKFFLPELDFDNVSPVRIGAGVTKDFLKSDDRVNRTKEFSESINKSIASMADKKVIIAEGTGHPGVGNIVGLSNAVVSKMLKAPIIYIAGGGIGKSLDMLATDFTFFGANGADIRGVIFNKLFPSKLEDSKFYLKEDLIKSMFSQYFNNLNVLGYLPEDEFMNKPSMRLLMSKFNSAKPINNWEDLNWARPCRKVKIISLTNKYFLPEDHLQANDLVILSSASKRRLKKIVKYNEGLKEKLSGVILSCGTIHSSPKTEQVHLLKNSGLPAMYVDTDSSETDEIVQSCIKNTKIQFYDDYKISKIKKLFDENFDKERFFKIFGL